jgi:hypothetical protein
MKSIDDFLNLVPFRPFLINLPKDFATPLFRPYLCIAAEVSAPWQHCQAGHRVLMGKATQLEKMYAAKGKIGTA